MFIWFKGKIVKVKDKIKKNKKTLVTEKESNILSNDEFVNESVKLKDLFQNLEGIIESDKSELAQIKIEIEEKRHIIKELEQKIEKNEIEKNEISSVLESRKINDIRFKNQHINTDSDSLESFPYKIKKPISAEWKNVETTSEEPGHESVKIKKDNESKYTLKLCKRCGGEGCLICNNTGYEDH